MRLSIFAGGYWRPGASVGGWARVRPRPAPGGLGFGPARRPGQGAPPSFPPDRRGGWRGGAGDPPKFGGRGGPPRIRPVAAEGLGDRGPRASAAAVGDEPLRGGRRAPPVRRVRCPEVALLPSFPRRLPQTRHNLIARTMVARGGRRRGSGMMPAGFEMPLAAAPRADAAPATASRSPRWARFSRWAAREFASEAPGGKAGREAHLWKAWTGGGRVEAIPARGVGRGDPRGAFGRATGGEGRRSVRRGPRPS